MQTFPLVDYEVGYENFQTNTFPKIGLTARYLFEKEISRVENLWMQYSRDLVYAEVHKGNTMSSICYSVYKHPKSTYALGLLAVGAGVGTIGGTVALCSSTFDLVVFPSVFCMFSGFACLVAPCGMNTEEKLKIHDDDCKFRIEKLNKTFKLINLLNSIGEFSKRLVDYRSDISLKNVRAVFYAFNVVQEAENAYNHKKIDTVRNLFLMEDVCKIAEQKQDKNTDLIFKNWRELTISRFLPENDSLVSIFPCKDIPETKASKKEYEEFFQYFSNYEGTQLSSKIDWAKSYINEK